MRYSTGNKLVDKTVDMLVSRFDATDVVNRQEDCKLELHFDKIKKMKKVFDTITLDDISFDDDFISVSFIPKF